MSEQSILNLLEQNSYLLSLLLGAIMIAVFARRRLELVSADFTEEFTPFLQAMTASKVLGRKQYNQAYALYLMPLLLIYGVLCLSQPIAGYFLEVDTDEVWATEAGPFFVASFIVAVGPNAGWFESLETGIRRFAQRLAGIPEDLFDLVNVIKRFDVLDPEISRSLPNEWLQNSARVADAAELIGLDPNETSAMRRNIVTSLALHSWVVAEAARAIWSEAIRTRFLNMTTQLAREMRRLRSDGATLVKDTRETALARDAESRTASVAGAPAPDSTEVISALRTRDTAANAPLLQRWEEYCNQVAATAQEYRLVFALFTINDRNPRFDPRQRPALARLLDAVWRPRINRTLNRAGVAIFAGLVSAFGAVMLWKIVRAYGRGDLVGDMAVPTHRLLRDAADLGWTNTLGTFAALIVPIVLAVFIRACKKSDRTWVPMVDESGGFPFVQAARLIAYSMAVSLVLSGSWVLLYQLFSEGGDAALKKFFSMPWGDKTAISAAGGILSCVLCYALDLEDKRRYTIGQVMVLAASVGCLLALYVSVVHLSLWDDGMFREFTRPVSLYTIRYYDSLIQDALVYAVFSGAFLLMFTFPTKHAHQTVSEAASEVSPSPVKLQRPELVYSASMPINPEGAEHAPADLRQEAAART